MGKKRLFGAVSRDGRSYSGRLLPTRSEDKICILSISGVSWRMLPWPLALWLTGAQEDEDRPEVPDESSDPIMSTIMLHAVRLRTSGIAMDRDAISGNLISDK
jgi:U-box domain